MKPFTRIGLAVAAMFLLCTAQRSQSRAAELRVITAGPDGQPVRLTRADIYLDIWGAGRLVPMSRDGRGATMRIDRAFLCQVFPEGCSGLSTQPSRLILLANGFAPVTRSFGIAEDGASFELRVSFRRPINRSIQIVDDSGAPVSGANLSGQILFAQTNHCGVTEGEPLFQTVTDQSGRSRIPDVDGDIYIELGMKHAMFQKPGPVSPIGLIVTADSFPTSLAIHRFDRQALQLLFVREGKPATGLKLQGFMGHSGCGAAFGVIGETDSSGRIRIEDFYPDEWESLELLDASGTAVWKGEVPDNPSGREATITLR